MTKTRKHVSHVAFTMAEILLSLTIIGVVAAITLPSLTGNINERTWNTQRKALYARFSQAIALMPALNGFGTVEGTFNGDGTQTITDDNAAETFVTAGLSKVLKINNICDSTHLEDCGIPSSYTKITGAASTMPTDTKMLNSTLISQEITTTGGTVFKHKVLNTKAVAFETQNGESILLFYHPTCVSNMGETWWYLSQPKICVNMIYDLNGSKGPNTVNKDIGIMSILYPTDSVVVAPYIYNEAFADVAPADAPTICTEKTGQDYRIATKEELASIFAFRTFTGLASVSGGLMSSSSATYTQLGEKTRWALNIVSGLYQIPFVNDPWGVICVKR